MVIFTVIIFTILNKLKPLDICVTLQLCVLMPFYYLATALLSLARIVLETCACLTQFTLEEATINVKSAITKGKDDEKLTCNMKTRVLCNAKYVFQENLMANEEIKI